jgi:hypothetical protein
MLRTMRRIFSSMSFSTNVYAGLSGNLKRVQLSSLFRLRRVRVGSFQPAGLGSGLGALLKLRLALALFVPPEGLDFVPVQAAVLVQVLFGQVLLNVPTDCPGCGHRVGFGSARSTDQH